MIKSKARSVATAVLFVTIVMTNSDLAVSNSADEPAEVYSKVRVVLNSHEDFLGLQFGSLVLSLLSPKIVNPRKSDD